MSTSLSGLSGNFFPSAQNGFSTTLASTISSGATTVPLNSVAGYSNGQIAVMVVDPTDVTKKQTFTGVVDTAGVQLTSVVWTAGTNQSHSGGSTVVDYATATHISMVTKGLLIGHTQTGLHALTSSDTLTSSKFLTSLNDTNGNELFKITATASAVNEITLANAATGNGPTFFATGGDSNIDINLVPKGTGKVKAQGNPVTSRLGLDAKTTTGTLIPVTVYTTYCTVTATSAGGEVEFQYGANIQDAASGAARSGHIRVQLDSSTVAGSDIIWETATNNLTASPVMTMSSTPAAGSHTWTLQVEADTLNASNLNQAYLRVSEVT